MNREKLIKKNLIIFYSAITQMQCILHSSRHADHLWESWIRASINVLKWFIKWFHFLNASSASRLLGFIYIPSGKSEPAHAFYSVKKQVDVIFKEKTKISSLYLTDHYLDTFSSHCFKIKNSCLNRCSFTVPTEKFHPLNLSYYTLKLWNV